MKNKITSGICLAFFTVIGFALSANPIETKMIDTLKGIEIKGKITQKNFENSTYKVELILNSLVVDSKMVSDSQSFSFNLPDSFNYLIKVYKEGSLIRSINVNEYISGFAWSIGKYKCEFIIDAETVANEVSGPTPIPFNWSRKYSKKVRPLP
jgi:hypothetical protein